ncbi:MAG: GTP cyclohydrolase II [Arcobacteraceae bacterium]|jgi:GTP cyclohydrolase II|nr:GTP cyclohydrolase II [Arcobacteraceae bacterium]
MKIETSNIANLPTKHGNFLIQSFKEGIKEHLVIMSKEYKVGDDEIVNVRIHSECLTGDAIGSIKCDCQAQLNFALEYINTNGGMVIYLRQEGRNIGLLNKVNAYNLQDKGFNTVEANHQLGFASDERTYEIVDFIFKFYGIEKINLLTNNPDKLDKMKVKIISRIPIIVGQTKENAGYMSVKKEEMGHLI